MADFNRFEIERALVGARLTLAEVAVFRALLIFVDEAGVAWPSVETIAAHAHASERTVQRALQSLVREGWVRIVPRCGTSALYTCQGGVTHRRGCHSDGGVTVTGVSHSHPQGCHTVTPGVSLGQGGGVTVTGGGCHSDGGGVSHSHPNIPVNNPENTPNGAVGASAPARVAPAVPPEPSPPPPPEPPVQPRARGQADPAPSAPRSPEAESRARIEQHLTRANASWRSARAEQLLDEVLSTYGLEAAETCALQVEQRSEVETVGAPVGLLRALLGAQAAERASRHREAPLRRQERPAALPAPTAPLGQYPASLLSDGARGYDPATKQATYWNKAEGRYEDQASYLARTRGGAPC